MKLKKLFEILDELSPFEFQEEWDNSGLILGSLDVAFENIYVGIDVDFELLQEISENSVLIVHHPIIFRGLKKLDFSSYPSNLIQKAIQKNISIIAMHTNYDKTHLNRYVLEEVLGFKMNERDEYLCSFDVNLPFDEFAKKVAKALGLYCIKTVCSHKEIKTASICTGSGASELSNLKTNCLLTGDIKYHEALEAKENKISLIEIGHYESEVHFGSSLKKELQNYGLSAIIANSKNPFRYIT